MKILKIIALFLAVFLLFTNMNCENEPINPHPGFTDTLFQSQEFLDYWYFKEGSWWVYKRTDTTAEIYDTAFVKKAWKEFIFSKYAMPYAIERYYMDVYHNAECFTKKGYFGCNINYESNQQNMLSVNYGGGYFGGRNFFWWPIEFTTYGSFNMLDTADIVIISGYYENVVHINDGARPNGDFWISKNIGLIKTDLRNGEEWELINCRLIK